MKAVRVACEAKDIEKAKVALVKAFSIIDRAVVKGIEHKGTANRQKSHLQLLVNKLGK